MWDKYIGRQIRRSNRNLLLLNGSLVLLLLGAGLICQRYLYNFCFGPFPLDSTNLVQLTDADVVHRYYITVSTKQFATWIMSDKVIRKNEKTNTIISETITADYHPLYFADRYLLVKVPHDDAPLPPVVSGRLIVLPGDVRARIVGGIEKEYPPLRGKCLPLMVDATGFYAPGYWGLALGLPLLLFGLWNLCRGLRRSVHPEQHPLVGQLAHRGPPGEIVRSIGSEVEREAPRASLRSPIITSSWLLKPTFFGLRVISLADVVWVYKKVTRNSVNGISTGSTHAAIINQRNGPTVEITGTEQSSDQVLHKIFGQVPWALAGYDAELAALWQTQKDMVLDIVEQRRKGILHEGTLEQ